MKYTIYSHTVAIVLCCVVLCCVVLCCVVLCCVVLCCVVLCCVVLCCVVLCCVVLCCVVLCCDAFLSMTIVRRRMPEQVITIYLNVRAKTSEYVCVKHAYIFDEGMLVTCCFHRYDTQIVVDFITIPFQQVFYYVFVQLSNLLLDSLDQLQLE